MLSANFESTVPGLYFVGLSAANVFGPFLRFACGAGFAAGRLAESPNGCRVQPLCGQRKTSRFMSVAKERFRRMDNPDNSAERHSAPGPGILLVAANRWSLTAQIASGFLDLGCRVAAVCPLPGHPIRMVRGVTRIYRYAPRQPLESLHAAIERIRTGHDRSCL